MIEPFVVPHFDNETDEANWWYDHRADIERLFDQHAAAGTLRWTNLADFKRRRAAAAPPHDALTSMRMQDLPMPTRIVSTTNTEHYTWGTDCDGWHLVKSEGLSVIQERMPPGRSEERHAHKTSRQFFFVLEGELTLEVEHHDFVIPAGKGVEVHPGQAHTAINRSGADVRMLVISQPPSHGDRTPA